MRSLYELNNIMHTEYFTWLCQRYVRGTFYDDDFFFEGETFLFDFISVTGEYLGCNQELGFIDLLE